MRLIGPISPVSPASRAREGEGDGDGASTVEPEKTHAARGVVGGLNPEGPTPGVESSTEALRVAKVANRTKSIARWQKRAYGRRLKSLRQPPRARLFPSARAGTQPRRWAYRVHHKKRALFHSFGLHGYVVAWGTRLPWSFFALVRADTRARSVPSMGYAGFMGYRRTMGYRRRIGTPHDRYPPRFTSAAAPRPPRAPHSSGPR